MSVCMCTCRSTYFVVLTCLTLLCGATASLPLDGLALLQADTQLSEVSIPPPSDTLGNEGCAGGVDVSLLQFNIELSNSSTTSAKNLCMGGRLAPEVLVLGFQKSATTSLCSDLAQRDFVFASVGMQDKPWFDKEATIFNHMDRFSRGKDWWLAHYPQCHQKQRQVAVDCTPYLGTGGNPLGTPQRIYQRYGSDVSRLQLVVLLREPVSRMQSAFYYSQERAYLPSDQIYLDSFKSFQAYIDYLITEGRDSTTVQNGTEYVENIYEISNYALYLENLLLESGASPKQLLVIPMQLLHKPPNNWSSAVETLETRLQVQGAEFNVVDTVKNPTSHPHLEDDLTVASLARIRAQIAGPQSVAKVLASFGIGATLYGYSGSPSDETAIALWLQENW